MKLDIVIPTKWRKEKLDTCLNSIFVSAENKLINLYLYFSVKEEYEFYQQIFREVPNIHTILLEFYRVPDFWNKHLSITDADAMCYLNDDCVVFEDTISSIFKEFEEHFPDYDGVIGLNQLNLNDFQTVDGAFGVIGIKYAERFPGKKVWCPDYNRFYADFELWQMAKELNKFHFSRQAQIIHCHPVIDKRLEDDTHRDVRKYIRKDKETFNRRKEMGLLWGKSFQTITQGV